MSKMIFRCYCFFVLSSFSLFAPSANAQEDIGWKAGVARVVVTPEYPMWMAGYGARDHESEGTLHDLWAKALAIEDAEKKRAVLITTDLLGFPRELSDRIRDRAHKKFGLERSQIILNSSHTHCGPVLDEALSDIYPLDPHQVKKIRKYTAQLEDKIVALVGKSLQAMQPAKIFSANGVARFQVNRRNNDASTLDVQSDLNGPNDYAVPVIKVESQSGDLLALAFGYACHNTVLANYQWSGDYAGFAQLELEQMYPGATAMFFQGAGADQNPLPRRTVALAQQYGRTLAAAVDRVLQEDMQPLGARLSTAYTEVPLSLNPAPGKADLARMAEEYSGYQKRWATRMLKKVENGEPLLTGYPFPLQVWNVGGQSIFALGGELVVEYAIELKRVFGPDAFVMGYSNDVMAYIPSTTILREGGYEGKTSQMVYGLPGTWASNIETVILHEIVRLARQAGVPQVEYKY
jgi:neutral ceramidase